ncbi:hypothetical protein DMB65_06265 [Flavobacterium cheongpyeongense]|uniref:Uncharacterized protein n=1 Tax=Flavobacterium cheongpyeongense TaxID=2212651 RepID=A0A2V4BRB1_9FLAO|nr:hypothetical protein [Flavobacterium cheongpyeongense]PXY41555.1 hypothetical protein DMB65_06265 [Flavobacterium cheongpyeongense]
MNRLFIVFIICLLLLNCTKKESPKKNIPYIISQNNKKRISGKDTIPPHPPIPGWLFYGTNTFIIDKNSRVYYFQRNEIGHICRNWGKNDTIPYFIDLQPKDLIEIPTKTLYDFIKLNYKDNFRNITFIASKLDTLNSKTYFDLVDAIQLFEKEGDSYFIRRTTQEEDTVLKHKKNNLYYNSKNIKWNNERITFPFVKPILNHK